MFQNVINLAPTFLASSNYLYSTIFILCLTWLPAYRIPFHFWWVEPWSSELQSPGIAFQTGDP